MKFCREIQTLIYHMVGAWNGTGSWRTDGKN